MQAITAIYAFSVVLDARSGNARPHVSTEACGRGLPDLMDRVLRDRIQPGKVFDLMLPIEQVAEGYKAMDERRAIKTLLTVG